MRFLKITTFFFSFLIFCTSINEVSAASSAAEKRMFTITGYYSPLPGQSFYVTGDYASEIRLNGKGIQGADGTPVYPGMMAAPGSVGYGTVICVPGFGCGKVHDRGQAIVNKGQRKLAQHDRLDMWMGYGEEGLLRALTWGVKHLECEIYSPETKKAVAVNFQVPLALNQLIDVPVKEQFETNLRIGMTSNEVKRLQRGLMELGIWEGEPDGIFDTEIEEVIFQFQLYHMIVQSKDETGAGTFGPKTRAVFADELYNATIQRQVREMWEEFHFDEDTELKQGVRSSAVFKLQQLLVEQEFLLVQPTGYFGPLTKEAVTEFQVAHEIIASPSTRGAGVVGPGTREKLNNILAQEKEFASTESAKLFAYKKIQQKTKQMAGNSFRSDSYAFGK